MQYDPCKRREENVKVRDAITQLSQLPQDLNIKDEYATEMIISFYPSSYDDDEGYHPYVAYEVEEI